MKGTLTELFKSVKRLNKRNKAILAAVIVIALGLPVTVLAIDRPDQPQPTKENNSPTHSENTDQEVAAAVTLQTMPQEQAIGQPTPSSTSSKQANKPTAPSAKPADSGDLHKQHPTPWPGTATIRPLVVSQSVFQIHVGQTSDAITANGSGTSISNVNLDYSESTPGLENNLSITYDGPYIPGWATTQTFRLVALPSATPGTYIVRLTVGTETETMNSKNPVFYRTTITATILP